jgi:signal transduction histidine kinase
MLAPVSEVKPARTPDLGLLLFVGLGLLVGLAEVAFDVLSEARIGRGTLTGALASVHAVVDHTFPVLLGGLLGVSAHYLLLRRRLAGAYELAARAEALRTRLQKVERDQAVWVVAAAVLHELNNPLHAIGLLLDELDAAADAPDEATRRRDLLSRTRVQADRALSHLRALRSMRSPGEPEMDRVALDRIAGAVADDVAPLAAEDGLEVRMECEQPVQASADEGYVRTILENLVDNSMHSLRVAGGPGRITIRVASEDGRAVVRVSDSGPALGPGVRDALFEPLRTTKTQGLGLGLPIARALARSMRGDLSLDEGAGKTFRLELPLSSAGAPFAMSGASAPAQPCSSAPAQSCASAPAQSCASAPAQSCASAPARRTSS